MGSWNERLLKAAENGDLDELKLCVQNLDCHIDEPKTTPNQSTALMMAVFNGHPHCFEYLLNLGADPNYIRENGTTFLHASAVSGHIQLLQYFLDKGLHVESKDVDGWTPLMHAVANGNLDCVEELTKRAVDLHAVKNDGANVLIIAAANGHIKLVKYFLDNGLHIESRTNEGWTPLMFTAAYGHHDCVEELLKRGANLNAVTNVGLNALMIAAANGRLEVVRYLADKGLSIESKDSVGWTPLMFAVANGNLDCLEELTKRAADLHAVKNDGANVLIIAAANGRIEVIRYLLDKGLDIESRDNDGWIPLMYAAKNGHLDCVEELVNRGADLHAVKNDGGNLLLIAAETGQVELLKYLLDCGLNIESQNYAGETALMYASSWNKPNCVRELIKRGAKIEHASNDGWTALLCAVRKGDEECINELITNDANLHVLTKDGSNALMIAAGNGQLEVLRELLNSGLSIGSVNNDGWTPLMRAVANGNLDCVEELTKRGVDLHAVKNDGANVLIMAAAYGHIKLVGYFLDIGLDIESRDNNGHTTLMHAASNGYLDCVEELVKRGADVHAIDNDGDSALDYANYRMHPEVSKYLLQFSVEDSRKRAANSFKNIEERKPSGEVIISQILSELSVAVRSAALGKRLNPRLFLEEELIKAKSHSTNVPYYDQKYYEVQRDLFRLAAGNLLVEDRKLTSPISEVGNHNIRDYFFNSAAIDLVQTIIVRAQRIRINNDPYLIPEQIFSDDDFSHIITKIKSIGQNDNGAILKDSFFGQVIERIKGQLKELNGEAILSEDARYSFPMSNVETFAEFILHSSAIENDEFIGEDKQSALVYAAKKNRPDLMMGMVIGRLVAAKYGEVSKQENLDEALFWGIFYGNYTTVKLCLELGADIESVPVLNNISCGELARHLSDERIVRAIASSASSTYEEFSIVDMPNIKQRYAKIAVDTATKLYPSNPSLRIGFATLLTDRFLQGKYVKYQLRLILKEHDNINLSSIDATHDLFRENNEVPEIPELNIEMIKRKGINVCLPEYRNDLVSEAEIQQIYQELIVANMLGQCPSLSLESFGSCESGRKVELPEALKNTLTGEVLIYTDASLKAIWDSRMFMSPENIRGMHDQYPKVIMREEDSLHDMLFTATSLPDGLTNDEYIKAVNTRYYELGGVHSEEAKQINAGYILAHSKFMQENGFVENIYGAGRWMNTGYVMRHSGNNIYCEQDYTLHLDAKYKSKNGDVVEFNDDPNHPMAKYIAEKVAQAPERARLFELLKVIYSLQPIAQLAVAHDALPDFSDLIIPSYVETPDYLPYFVTGTVEATPNLDSLKQISDMLAESSNQSLRAGTAYSTSKYNKSKSDAAINKKVAISCPVSQSVAQATASNPYNSDFNKPELHTAGSLFYTLFGYKGEPESITPVSSVNDRTTAKEYHERLQIRNDDGRPHRDTLVELRLIVDSFLPTGPAHANPKLGEGGWAQSHAGNAVDSKTGKYEKILEPTGNTKKLL